ncbi:hypothetical protein [Alicyclobacillus sp. SO9]|uniref:hypothetical protein n=1 Tax=Alicyclobacillus sp. SO9 TaxID=2665646 RepID=UPI0018E7E7B4|nr:hypothetical protein [Alicyclobacillus sp. SO9]QQE79964.1 hypothetical protein GI364_05660 [Alicyclobacillus sp. SO9]
MTLHIYELIGAIVVVGVPVVFALGRYSNRITWFHARTEEKYSVPEFMRDHQ